ncbi:MAG: hypothetical protein KJ062_19885 [Thermoanaerobaculia bacterium]|nr:hypothetical protein [Thermoanaerobaculia bacterium]
MLDWGRPHDVLGTAFLLVRRRPHGFGGSPVPLVRWREACDRRADHLRPDARHLR